MSAISAPAPVAWTRTVWLALTAIVLGLLAARYSVILTHPDNFRAELGGDYRLYVDAARRWLAGGTFYDGFQYAGPYVISGQTHPILYPPTMLVLLVPFTVLPAVLWWAIPAAITVGVIVHWRPAMWAWPLLLAPLLTTHSGYLLVNGTPTIWIVAFVALATLRPWLGALVLVKPSVFPFALGGMRDPRWWVLAAGLVALSLPMAVEYVTILRNSNGTLLYSLNDVPLLAIPLIAYVSRGAAGRSPATAR